MASFNAAKGSYFSDLVNSEPNDRQMQSYNASATVEGFDPEGSGYDDATAAPLIKEFPLTVPKPNKYQGDYVQNEGAFQAWVWHPEINDYKLHSASRNPHTGLLLKGRKHETWDKLVAGEKEAGYTIFRGPDGRYYSQPATADPNAASWRDTIDFNSEPNDRQMQSYNRQRGSYFNDLVADTGEPLSPVNDPSVAPIETEPMKLARLARRAAANAEGGLRNQAGSMTGSLVGAVALPALVNMIPGMAFAPEEAITVPLGRALGSSAGRFVTSLAGSFAGGTAGQAAQDVLDPTESASLTRALWGGGREALTDLASAPIGALTKLALRGGRAGLSGISKAVTRNLAIKRMVANGIPSDQALKVAQRFVGDGGEILETQISNTLLPELKETIARGAIGGKDIFKEYADRVNQEAADSILKWADEIRVPGSSSRKELGEMLTRQNIPATHPLAKEAAELARKPGEALELLPGEATQRIRSAFDNVYAEIDSHLPSTRIGGSRVTEGTFLEHVPGQGVKSRTGDMFVPAKEILGVKVPTTRLKKISQEILEKNATVEGSVGPETLRIAEKIKKWPRYMTIQEVRDLEKHYRTVADRMNFQTSEDYGFVSRIRSELNSAIVDDTKIPEEYRRMYRQANNAYRNSKEVVKELFDTSLVDALYKNPEEAIELMGLRPKAGSGEGPLTQILKLRGYFEHDAAGRVDALGRVQWERIQKAATQDVLNRSVQGGKIKATTITRYMNQMRQAVEVPVAGGGKRVTSALMELHGKEGMEVMKNAIELEKLLQGRAESLGLIIHGMQAGAVTAGLYGGVDVLRGTSDNRDLIAIGAGAALIIGPRALAKSLTTKRGYEIIKAIAKKPPIPMRAKLIGKLVRIISDSDNAEAAKANRVAAQRRQQEDLQKQPTMRSQRWGMGAMGF